jgi:CHAD domain-containing protein
MPGGSESAVAKRAHNAELAAAADEPVAKAAARMLTARLSGVHDLALAAAESRRDPESIHALRVATRRAAAALDAFAPLLPRRRSARLHARLQRLRRAAGDVRDLDVLLAGLHTGGRDAAPMGAVRAAIERRRRAAWKRLDEALRRVPGKKRWRRRVEKVVERIGGARASTRFDRFAARRLAVIARAFFTACAERAADLEALHRLRILGKKTRYAIEIFAPTAIESASRRSALEQFERFQDLAGRCIDHATAAACFTRLARNGRVQTLKASFERLATAEAKAAEGARKRALAWVTPARIRALEHDLVGRSTG